MRSVWIRFISATREVPPCFSKNTLPLENQLDLGTYTQIYLQDEEIYSVINETFSRIEINYSSYGRDRRSHIWPLILFSFTFLDPLQEIN